MSIIVSVCVRIDTESFVEAEVLSVFTLNREGLLLESVRADLHTVHLYLFLPWGQGIHSVQSCFSLP
mgnify:CR=1|jgi:hypothetical protein